MLLIPRREAIEDELSPSGAVCPPSADFLARFGRVQSGGDTPNNLNLHLSTAAYPSCRG